MRGASHRSLRPLRAGAASACRLRRAAAAASRMVPRPRAHRAHAVRRRAACRETATIRPDLSRPGLGLAFKCARRRAIPSCMRTMESATVTQTGRGALALGADAARLAHLARDASAIAGLPAAMRRCRGARACRPSAAADAGGRQVRRGASTGPPALLALSVLPTARSSITAARSTTRRCTRRSSSAR